MGVTAKFGIPYPEKTDVVDVPLDMQELAVQVDSSLDFVNKHGGYISSGLPSPVGAEGRMIYVTDMSQLAYSDGARWILPGESRTAVQVQAGFTESGVAYGATSETFCSRITDLDGTYKWGKGWRPRIRLSGLISCSTSNIAYACVGMHHFAVAETGIGSQLINDLLNQIQESAGAGINYFAKKDWYTIDDADLVGAAPSKAILQFNIRTRVSGGVGTYNHMSLEVQWVFEP